ncbi:SGCD (predicted) [Pycnogonum litorale]
MIALQIPIKMDIDDSPRASISKWDTLNTDFKPCRRPIGINGWKKNLLYALVIITTVMVILNTALLVWIIRVMDFSIDGMGNLRISESGIRVEGDSEFMKSLHASHLRTLPGVPLTIESSSNITMAAYDNENTIVNSLYIGNSSFVAQVDRFTVLDEKQRIIFQAKEDEIVFSANNLKIQEIDEHDGGIEFAGSLQTPLLRSGYYNSLRLESPNRKIYLDGPEGVAAQSRAGGIIMSCLNDLIITTTDGNINFHSKKVQIQKLQIVDQSDLPFSKSRKSSDDNVYIPTYQLCVCDDGILLLASPEDRCQYDGKACD